MKIESAGPRERILLMGAAGSGKSNAIISIAKSIDATVHVLDTELDTYERLMWEEEHVGNLDYYGVMTDDWMAMKAWSEGIHKVVDRDDIVVVDSMTPVWSAVQQWFSDEIMGDSLDDLMLEARRELKGGNVNPFEGWTDWSVINAQYQRFIRNLLRCNAAKAHVIVTAVLDVIQQDESKETRALFGKFGAKPRGQKRLAHFPHDILFMRQTREGWEFDTAKAQGTRAKPDNVKVVDFAKQYLMGVAGWKVVPA